MRICSFQVFVMFSGLIGIIVKGLIDLGGVGEVWRRVYISDRVEFIEFD